MKGIKTLLTFLLGALFASSIWASVVVHLLFILLAFLIGFILFLKSVDWLTDNWSE